MSGNYPTEAEIVEYVQDFPDKVELKTSSYVRYNYDNKKDSVEKKDDKKEKKPVFKKNNNYTATKPKFNTYNKPYNKKFNRYENNNIHVMNQDDDYSSDSNASKIEARSKSSNVPESSEEEPSDKTTVVNQGTWAVEKVSTPISNNYLQISQSEATSMMGPNNFLNQWRSMRADEIIQIRKGDLIKLSPRIQQLFLLKATTSADDYTRGIGPRSFGPPPPPSPPTGAQFIGNNPSRWRPNYSPHQDIPFPSPQSNYSINNSNDYATDTTIPASLVTSPESVVRQTRNVPPMSTIVEPPTSTIVDITEVVNPQNTDVTPTFVYDEQTVPTEDPNIHYISLSTDDNNINMLEVIILRPESNIDLDTPGNLSIPCTITISYKNHFNIMEGIIDTGANVTCIPLLLASEWDIPTKQVSVRMGNETTFKHIQTVIPINIKLANINFLVNPVCIGTRTIIGMDILHKTSMKYDKGKFMINNLNCNNTILLSDIVKPAPVARCDPYTIKLKKDVVPHKSSLIHYNHLDEHHIIKQVKDWLNSDIIEPSSSSWGSQPILVNKQNSNEKRLCINYKPLNKCTEIPVTVLPHIQNIIRKIAACKYKITIDLKHGYLQVPLDFSSRHLTAFITPVGLFQFKRMPFGLAGAPQHFQSQIISLLNKFPEFNNQLFVYIDDIIIGAQDENTLMLLYNKILQQLKIFNWTINTEKSTIISPDIQILGYLIKGHTISPPPKHMTKLLQLPIQGKNDVITFIGILTYLRKYLVKIVHIYNEIKSHFMMGEEVKAINLCKDLQKRLQSDPNNTLVVHPLNIHNNLHIFVDYSHDRMAFIACQTKEPFGTNLNFNNLNIIDLDFKITPPLKKPNAQRGELKAIFFALQKCEYLLLPNITYLHTDNINIVNSDKIFRQHTNIQLDIISHINKYNIKIIHLPGKNNYADPISRLISWTIKQTKCKRIKAEGSPPTRIKAEGSPPRHKRHNSDPLKTLEFEQIFIYLWD